MPKKTKQSKKKNPVQESEQEQQQTAAAVAESETATAVGSADEDAGQTESFAPATIDAGFDAPEAETEKWTISYGSTQVGTAEVPTYEPAPADLDEQLLRAADLLGITLTANDGNEFDQSPQVADDPDVVDAEVVEAEVIEPDQPHEGEVVCQPTAETFDADVVESQPEQVEQTTTEVVISPVISPDEIAANEAAQDIAAVESEIAQQQSVSEQSGIVDSPAPQVPRFAPGEIYPASQPPAVRTAPTRSTRSRNATALSAEFRSSVDELLNAANAVVLNTEDSPALRRLEVAVGGFETEYEKLPSSSQTADGQVASNPRLVGTGFDKARSEFGVPAMALARYLGSKGITGKNAQARLASFGINPVYSGIAKAASEGAAGSKIPALTPEHEARLLGKDHVADDAQAA